MSEETNSHREYYFGIILMEGFLYPPATFRSTIFDRQSIIEDPYPPFLKKKKMFEEIMDYQEYYFGIVLSRISFP